MNALFVTSPGAGEGKTALALGLGRWLQARGRSVGYLKPGSADGDAAFARQALSLSQPQEALSPLPSALAQSLAAREEEVVLIEGPHAQAEARAAGARGLLVFHPARHSQEEVAAAASAWGDRLLGVVVNAVPRRWLYQTRSSWQPFLEGRGVRALGFLPEDRTLVAPSIGELAQRLGGNLILYPEKAEELVEDVLVGVLWVDPIPLYFGQKPAKAVVARGDRPDVQLGALETPTRCLIVTGGLDPHPYIYYRAKDRGVPLMVVKDPTPQVMAALEVAIQETRFRQEKKFPRLLDLMAENLDLEAVARALKASPSPG